MFVKVCGLRSREQIDWAVELGYSAVGIVLHPASPRYCDAHQARDISLYARGRIATVAVGISYSEVRDICDDVDFMQIYEFIDSDKLIYAGLKPPGKGMFRYFLYDASMGSGKFHPLPSWLLEQRDRLIISGGLSAANIGSIICQYLPFGIDVSSGVEEELGIKSFEKMRDFIAEVRHASH